MRQSASWSIGLGRWGGVQLRVHMFFWLFAAFTLFLSWSRSSMIGRGNLTWVVAAGIGIWFISLLLHECGHLLTALRFGGESEQIVIWPFGGLEPPRPLPDPRHEFAMHLAGPLVNAGLCLISGIVVAMHAGGDVGGLLNPLAPKNLLEPPNASWLLIGAKLTCWINCVLWLANLLPAFPFDGGRAMRAGLLATRPDLSPRRAVLLVTSLAKVVAFVLIVIALLMWSNETNPLIPVWFSLVLLAILLYFSARQEEERIDEVESEEQLFGYDFSQGYTSLERSTPSQPEPIGPFRRWLQERRQARLEQQRELEQEEERRVDEILGRLHEHGMESLSVEERLLLQRVSQRYRHRQERSN
jgi:stage IV sporulation protein FB